MEEAQELGEMLKFFGVNVRFFTVPKSSPQEVEDFITLISAKKSLAEIKKMVESCEKGVPWLVNYRSPAHDNFNPFEIAVQYLDCETIKYLSQFLTDVHNTDNNKCDSSLQLAAYYGQSQTIDLLLTLGAKADHQNSRGYTALMHAAQNGHIEVMRKLLKACPQLLNMTTLQCISALHIAVVCKLPEVARFLIRYGADVNERNAYGQTPAHMALAAESYEVFDILFNYGEADPTLTEFKGRTFNALLKANSPVGLKQQIELRQAKTLRAAIKGNNLESFFIVISNGIDVNHTDEQGNTAMHHACAVGNLLFIRHLLAAGANTQIENYYRAKPIDLLDPNLHGEYNECIAKTKLDPSPKITDPKENSYMIPIGVKMSVCFAATSIDMNSSSNPHTF